MWYWSTCRSQWPRGLRRRSTAARRLRLWFRIPPGAWMFVCCEFCVLSGRGLCDGLIIRPGESYRLWRVVVCDLETSKMRRLKPATGLWEIQPKGRNAKKTTTTTTEAVTDNYFESKCYIRLNKVKCTRNIKAYWLERQWKLRTWRSHFLFQCNDSWCLR